MLNLLKVLVLRWRALFKRLAKGRVRDQHARRLLLKGRLDRLLTLYLCRLALGAKINLNFPGLSVAVITAYAIGLLVDINLNLASAGIAACRLLRLHIDSRLRDLAILKLCVMWERVRRWLAPLLFLKVLCLCHHLAVLATYPRYCSPIDDSGRHAINICLLQPVFVFAYFYNTANGSNSITNAFSLVPV